MKQFILLLISFCYGSFSGFLYYLLYNKTSYRFLTLISKTTYFIIITLLYIILIYILNNGSIHLYMKILLIGGSVFTLKCQKYVKRLINSNIIT